MPDPNNSQPVVPNRMTAEDLALLLGDLSEDKRELLELLLKEQGIDLADSVILPKKRNVLQDSLLNYMPLSFSQQRMWFLDQFEPGSPYYNIPSAVRLTGKVDVDLLAKSLNEIVARHESLRTTFSTLNDQPIQEIHSHLVLSIPVIDLEHIQTLERQAEAMRLANLEARQPFDLSKGPLIRVSLLRLSEYEHLFLMTMHHIISDGWSVGVLIHEMASLYEGYVTGKPARLPELPIQYPDFCQWQRDWLQGEVLEMQLEYWLNAFSEPQAVLELPTDRPRPAVLSSHGASYSFGISKKLTESLHKLSQQNNATLFMTLLASFQVLLYRYTGLVDLTVGTPIANRSRPELENLIGIFINTLALRTDLSGEPTFRELLIRAREAALGAYAHQDVPLEVIVEKLQVERDLSHNPLFQVMLILQNAPQQTIRLTGMTLETIEVHSGTSTFDITLTLTEIPDGLHASIEYNSDLFDLPTIERMFANWQVILEAVVANPDQKIATLPILTHKEQQQLLENFSLGPIEVDSKPFVHQRIRAQAAGRPDAIAIKFNEQELTYAELVQQADRLALSLRQKAINPGKLVGLCIPRSFDLVVAMLATLEAGGAYLPLDPNYPLQRLAIMLEDSQVSVILTLESVLEQKPDLVELFNQPGLSVICLDTAWTRNSLAGENDYVPGDLSSLETFTTQPDDLAYVIYTSGSTGRPKGVQISHRAVANFVAWAVKAYGIQASDRVLQFASLNFDTAVEEIFPTLISGAVLVLRPDPLLSFHDFQAWVAAQKLTVLDLPTAYWHAWVSDLELSKNTVPGCVRLVIVGGERALPEQFTAWRKISPQSIRWINTYGPTEATVVCLAYEPPPNWHETIAPLLPVGRPITNMQVLVVDANQQLVPIGVPGELWLAGQDLAQGYLNQPELTAEKFVHPPSWITQKVERLFSFTAQNCYYRTGDQVRFLPDGNLDFLGRVDQQIKLRGFRIELGEIEAILVEHPAVREAAVVVVEIGHQGDGQLPEKLLAAFVCQAEGSIPLEIAELQNLVKTKLPEYMAPAAYVVIPALPLTPSGKIDRKALAVFPIDSTELSRVGGPGSGKPEFVAPRTPIEEKLAKLWTHLLGVRQVGIHDNFFDMGGHSLLATQLISRVRGVFEVDLPLRGLFEAPTVAGLAEKIETAKMAVDTPSSIGSADSALPQPSSRLSTTVFLTPIIPVERDPITRLPLHPAPLSFAQQRLWFLEQFEPGTANYNIPSVLRLKGKLDVNSLESSLNEIVRRHEVLRTAILTVDGRPVQVIHPVAKNDIAFKVQLTLEDLSDLPESEREAQAFQRAQAEARLPFDLSQAPLFRAKLIRLGAEEHLALFTMHHIISDGWSTGVLVRELTLFYTTLAGMDPGMVVTTGSRLLPDLEIQYADYAAWQRQWLMGDELAEQLSFWKEQLSGLLPLLDLPTDRPRPAVQTVNGGLITFVIESGLVQALKTLSQDMEVTLFMTLLSAFQVLLMRYSGQTDISVGTPIANRTRNEIEDLIGFFINTLVLRTDLSGEPTFHEVLQRVREVALGAYTHQDVPFEMLVNELHPERDTSHTPLFQVMFVMQNLPSSDLELPGLKLSSIEVTTGTALFDLTLTIAGEDSDGLHAAFEYNSDLFFESTIQRMVDHLKVLLSSLVDQPDQQIGSLPMLTEVERQRILFDWNKTFVDNSLDLCVHHLFEHQAALTSSSDALVAGELSVTYSELNKRANQLAHFLIEQGVGPEKLVGLCVDRSVEMIVGLLGIMKAGGAYVPLDPAYPKERLAFMLDDIQADLVLTVQRFTHVLPGSQSELQQLTTADFRVVLLDQDWPIIARQSHENPPNRVSGDNLAYVIYTSGSTGRPKGVQIQHASLTNFVNWAKNNYQVQPRDRVLQFASLNFDTAIEEIFPTLTTGAVLVLRPEAVMTSFQEFHHVIEFHGLTILDLPTAYWHAWVSELAHNDEMELPASVRLVIVGGEQAQFESYVTWRKLVGNRAVWINTYGPSEATVVCLSYQPPEDWDQQEPRLLPIGFPLDNTRAYIVDKNMQLQPVGVPGELVISGAGLARGYLNLPELTAEKFVSFPDTWEVATENHNPARYGYSPQRLYHTGDRVRYLPDGAIDFLGRVDNQVKLRGMRIELGEIETILRQHPDVREALVLARQDHPGTMRLVAYVIPAQLDEVNDPIQFEEELRSFLKEKLPSFMLPSAFVYLDVFPLTPNGKINQKALPLPGANTASSEEGPNMGTFELGGSPGVAYRKQIVAPRTHEETILVEIWKQLLGLERVGIDDNFFELGGDSILSIQVTSRANQAGLLITPRQIFEAQTIAELAVLAGSGGAIQAEQGEIIGSAPLTPIERWFFDLDLPNPSHFNQALILEVSQLLDPQYLEAALTELIRHHDALRLRFNRLEQPSYSDSVWQQSIVGMDVLLSGNFSEHFEHVNLSGLSLEEQKQTIEDRAEQAQVKLDISTGPLIRVVYFTTGSDQPGRLLIVVHHLAVDGVSWRVFVEDLQNIYWQLQDPMGGEKPVQLPPKTTSYLYWSQRLSEYAFSSEALAELDYWVQVTEKPFEKILPDYLDGRNDEATGRIVQCSLDKEETSLLLQEVPSVYKTEINDILLAALTLTFREWLAERGAWPEILGETNLLLELEGHGREDIFFDVNLTRTVGWFTNIYPVCLTIKDFDGPGDVIKKVKEQLRAIPRRGIGYGVLRYLNPDGSKVLNTNNKPQLSFNYLGQIVQPLPSDQQVTPKSSLFGIATESSGEPHDLSAQRAYLLEINGGIAGGRLGLDWSYSSGIFNSETIDRLAERYLETLRELIKHCLSPDAGGFTSSDFPLAGLGQATLDKVISKVVTKKKSNP